MSRASQREIRDAKRHGEIGFARTQQSWYEHLLEKVQGEIDEREQFLLNERGFTQETLADDDKLYDLYEDEVFFARFSKDMKAQVAYLRKKYFNE
jgi:hypothetical protein